MKNLTTLLVAFSLSYISYSQCPASDILIDNFSGPFCGIQVVNADPVNTIAQTECTSQSGSLTGAADLWLQKTTSGHSAILYEGSGMFYFSGGSGNLSTFSITYDGEDGNTDPDNPTITGPVVGNFTNRTIQILATVETLGPGASLTVIGSVWDGSNNRSVATLILNGARPGSSSEILDLGAFSGSADLTDVRAFQLKISSTQNGFDFGLISMSAVCPGFTLPVKLTSFDGNYSDEITSLNWKTTDESGVDKYEIEVSNNGANFQKAGTVASTSLNKSSGSYHFTYNEELKSPTWFRLKVMDLDSKFFYSNIIVIKPNQQYSAGLLLYPTLFTDKISLSIPSPMAQLASLQIVSTNGTVVYRKQLNLNKGSNSISVYDLNKLPKGIYIAQVLLEDRVEYKKLVKQ